MSRYYHLKVKEVKKETEDAVSIHFWHPWNEMIQYKPGQYLTVLWPTPEGDKLRRSYSLSSSPYTDISPAITVKRLEGGIVSNSLFFNTREGDTVEVMQPTGTFCLEPDPDAKRTIFLLGAGSGITPLLSIAKSVLIAEPESNVVLMYGNRRVTDIIFLDTINSLKEKYSDRFEVIHSLTSPPDDWECHTGRLTQSKLEELLQPYSASVGLVSSLFFICGQEEFLAGARRALAGFGARQEAIHFELYFLYKEAEKEAPVEETPEAPSSRTISLVYEGQTHQLPVAAHQTVLEAALEKDIDLPYSCQAGMCTACLGRLIQGKVTLDEYDALTDAEIKEGFILTCVAHPQSDDVVIEVE